MAAITPGQRRHNEPSGRCRRFIRDGASSPKVLFVLRDEAALLGLRQDVMHRRLPAGSLQRSRDQAERSSSRRSSDSFSTTGTCGNVEMEKGAEVIYSYGSSSPS
ncbi:unnamed protein product [Pleuronectes platessa]|uniref:Uncharacterized protein n=1 Tax=Pleuronectes platessa TaxID=8262 RepID=A0A9N7Z2E6_PLEPL|nr:unnamed protein product [Pleuronectes platessa]